MVRRFHNRSRGTAPRRQTVWGTFTSGDDKITIPAVSAVLVSQFNAAALALRPFTIIRVRGVILVCNDQVAASEEPQMIVTAGVFSDTAVALGITALPDAVSSPDGNWYLYEDVPFGFLNDVDGNISWRSYVFDSKAMRKVGTDEDSAVVVSNRSAADGGQIIMSGRILLKLH